MISDLIELARRQPRIGDDRPGVEPARGEHEAGKRDRVLTDDHHAVAGANTEHPQRVRHIVHRAIELAIGQGRVVVDQRCPVRRRGYMRVHHFMNTVRQRIQNLGRGLPPTPQ